MIHDGNICDGNDSNDGNDDNEMLAMIAMDHLGREMSVLGRSATSAATNQIIDLNNRSSFCVWYFLFVFIFGEILFYLYCGRREISFSDENIIGENSDLFQVAVLEEEAFLLVKTFL